MLHLNFSPKNSEYSASDTNISIRSMKMKGGIFNHPTFKDMSQCYNDDFCLISTDGCATETTERYSEISVKDFSDAQKFYFNL